MAFTSSTFLADTLLFIRNFLDSNITDPISGSRAGRDRFVMTSYPQRDVKYPIITVKHDIHSHQTIKDVLEVQLTFKNKASYKQAYPIVEIIFSDPLGKIIAQRKLSPEEYLNNKVLHLPVLLHPHKSDRKGLA